MLNGKLLKDAIISASIAIDNKKTEIDELNIFPVPDGDTGTNMAMTMKNARLELERLEGNQSVGKIAAVTASALLRGARGNSGVILSLLFRGFSNGLKDMEEANCEDIANALELGVNSAYKAVMNPTEGTVLTVARLSAEKARQVSKTTNDTVLLWQEVCKASEEALAKTPELLPVLKKAGVVDAGGKGLTVIFEAMRKIFEGGKIETLKSTQAVSKTEQISAFEVFETEDINFSYCTEMLITRTERDKDILALRAYLETIGDCVLVVDDDEIIKIHVHTNHPGKVIEKALEYGTINLPKIENMRVQHEGKLKEEKTIKEQKFIPAKPEKKYGFVAVCAGKGIENMFKDLGADVVVQGGQTMNPSTEDILRAVQSVPAEMVFVLPNNKNIIMSAEQAVGLADRNICVLQTRTIPQGMSALLAFDETLDVSENRTNMTKAFEKVGTGQVTFSVRDSEYEGHSIRKGEILALENNKLVFTEKDVTKAAYKLTKRLVKSDTSYITIIYGADVTDESAEKLQKILQAKLNDRIEVILVNGGQPVYYYIISAE